MPCLARFEDDLKAEPSVSVYRLCRRVHRRNRYRPTEVAVAVGCAQMLMRFGPLRGDPASTHNRARLHLEDVGEIAAERNLELEFHGLHALSLVMSRSSCIPSLIQRLIVKPSVRCGIVPSSVSNGRLVRKMRDA